MEWISPSSDGDEATAAREEYRERFVGESFGRVNEAEAELTLLALEQYFAKIGKQRLLDERIDVGIISPYRAQVQYLRRLAEAREPETVQAEHIGEHRGWFSGTGARHHPHFARSGRTTRGR